MHKPLERFKQSDPASLKVEERPAIYVVALKETPATGLLQPALQVCRPKNASAVAEHRLMCDTGSLAITFIARPARKIQLSNSAVPFAGVKVACASKATIFLLSASPAARLACITPTGLKRVGKRVIEGFSDVADCAMGD